MVENFKVGDSVTCVKGKGGLHAGGVYTVAEAGEYVYLSGVHKDDPTSTLAGWYPDRFVITDKRPKVSARSNDPATSKGKRKVSKYKEAVKFLLGRNPGGLTGKEIAELSGFALNCITPRFAPLRRDNEVKDSGIKRDKQTVWVLA